MVLLLSASILLATTNNILLHVLSHKKLKYNNYLFNLCIVIIWATILIVFNRGLSNFTTSTIIFGLICGTTLACFLFFEQQSLTNGPIMLSSLIGCSSFIYTTIFNAIYWKEKVGLFEILGILLMIVAIFIVTYNPNKKVDNRNEKQKLSLKWKICSALFFLFAGLVGIVFRFHQSTDAIHTNEMMFFASITAIIFLVLILSLNKILVKNNNLITNEKNINFSLKNVNALLVFVTIGCGFASCIYNRLNIYLSGAMASTLFFPTFNGCVVLFSAISGWCFFKEKATIKQILGCLLGMLSIICLSHFFGLL